MMRWWRKKRVVRIRLLHPPLMNNGSGLLVMKPGDSLTIGTVGPEKESIVTFRIEEIK